MIRRDLSIDAFLHNFKKPFLLLVLHMAAIWLFQEACGVNTGQHLHFLL